MARIAFITWDGGGNVPPAVGLAQALLARGHAVHFFGYHSQRGAFAARGLGFSALDKSGAFSPREVPAEQRFPGLVGSVWHCADHLHDVPAALAAHAADAVVVDFLMHGAIAAATQRNARLIVLAHSALAGLVPPPDSPVGSLQLAAANAVRSSAGLPSLERLNDAWRDQLTLVTTIAELDPAAEAAGPLARYVGPIVEPLPRSGWTPPWREARPIVLVSFSTTGFWDQRGRILNTLAALAEEPVHVLVSAQGFDGPVPANAVVRPFVPHAEILEMAALTVTHCGHGTTAASLAHGVPVLGLPNPVADQPFLAKRVQALGAGLALDGEARPEEIRSAARTLLAEPSYKRAAAALRARITAASGGEGAAREVERWISA
jgi:MGT family glycosyltransferase